MMQSRILTRGVLWLVLVVGPSASLAQHAGVVSASRTFTTAPADSLYRHYDACAHVTVLGIPVFSRCGVGGGFASIAKGQDQSVVLQFVSGSSPDRAHGLNRIGLIQEVVWEEGSGAARSSYFGFMTSSGEESISQAKAALDDARPGRQVPYTVAQGLASGSSVRYSICQMQLPASFQWSDSAEMLRQIQQQLKVQSQSRPIVMNASEAGDQPAQLRTFLYAMRFALMSPAPQTQQSVVHNGTVYRLTIVKSADPKVGAELARTGLIASPQDALHLAGVIKNLKTRSETPFSVWYDASSTNILPLRFEFRPKSFLKLTFQADKNLAPPSKFDVRASIR